MRCVIESFAQYARHISKSYQYSVHFGRGGSPEPPGRLRSIAATRINTKQFERFVHQAYLIVSQTAWLNRGRKRDKLSALPQPAGEPGTPKVFASKELSRPATLQHSSEPTS